MVNKNIYAIASLILIVLSFALLPSLVLGQEKIAVPQEPTQTYQSSQLVSATGFNSLFLSVTIILSALGLFIIYSIKKLQIINLIFISILGIAAFLFFISVGFKISLLGFILASVYLVLIVKFMKSKKEENSWIKFASWLNVGVNLVGIIMVAFLFSVCFLQIRGMCDDIGTPLAAFTIAVACGIVTLISFVFYIVGFLKSKK